MDYEPSQMDMLYAEGITSSNGVASMEFSFPTSSQNGYMESSDQNDPLIRSLLCSYLLYTRSGSHDTCFVILLKFEYHKNRLKYHISNIRVSYKFLCIFYGFCSIAIPKASIPFPADMNSLKFIPAAWGKTTSGWGCLKTST